MSTLEETTQSLKRMQEFDSASLPRKEDLGKNLNFEDAVEPADKLISLYRRLSITVLEDFPDPFLAQIKQVADADYTRLKQILDFETSVANPQTDRDSYIAQLAAAYPTSFTALHQFISYGVSKATDFQRMETEARAMIQSVEDKAADLTKELAKNKGDAEQILSDIRSTAAEQGVSQQAIYFKEEAERHDADADSWKSITQKFAWALGGFAVLSLFIHKIPFFKPTDAFDAAQLITSKILIFGVIAYMLILAAKNFLSNKHNTIVNRHRQNALLTFNALVDAAKDEESKDIVLSQAASCIFSPQDTGYAKSSGDNSSGSNKTVVELVPRAIKTLTSQKPQE